MMKLKIIKQLIYLANKKKMYIKIFIVKMFEITEKSLAEKKNNNIFSIIP